VRVHEGNTEPDYIQWTDTTPGSAAERSAERGERVTPVLAEDAQFLLDLGGTPRDVEQWLRQQSEVTAAATVDESLFPPEQPELWDGQHPVWKRRRVRRTRRLLGRRTAR
jgi:hypothetical protein